MSILVTGGTGFIGSHLCRKLLNRGYEVTALSRSGRTDNIKELLTNRNFQLNTGDIKDTAKIRDLMSDRNIQTVFHLAAQLPTEKIPRTRCPVLTRMQQEH